MLNALDARDPRRLIPISVVALSFLTTTAPLAADPCGASSEKNTAELETPMPQSTAQTDTTDLVRVIVKVKTTATGGTDEPDAALEENKAELIHMMTDQGASLIEPIAGQPLIVMEVTSEGMSNLLASGLVEDIEEDTADQAFEGSG